MLRLYDYLESGNGYKVRLLLRLLGIPFERVEMDIWAGATRTQAFLARNPNGRIPTLALEDGTHLAESNAILAYLADGTTYWPADRLARAQVLQWMFFEQYSHEPYIAVSRSLLLHQPQTPERAAKLESLKPKGLDALQVMETQLSGREWIVGQAPTVADIALFAYTHVAGEGGFDLAPFSNVTSWITRFEAIPGFTSITQT